MFSSDSTTTHFSETRSQYGSNKPLPFYNQVALQSQSNHMSVGNLEVLNLLENYHTSQRDFLPRYEHETDGNQNCSSQVPNSKSSIDLTFSSRKESKVQNIIQRLRASANSSSRQTSSQCNPRELKLNSKGFGTANHHKNLPSTFDPKYERPTNGQAAQTTLATNVRNTNRNYKNYFKAWNDVTSRSLEEIGKVISTATGENTTICHINTADCENSATKQYANHLRQKSADFFSKQASPFQNLNYCRKTNLDEMKVSNDSVVVDDDDDDDGTGYDLLHSANSSGSLESRTSNQEQTTFVKDLSRQSFNRQANSNDCRINIRNSGQFDTPLKDSEKIRPLRRSSLLDSKPPLGLLKVPTHITQLCTRSPTSSLEFFKLKTRSGSLTESATINRKAVQQAEDELARELEESRLRVRGLSLSASCLPFKPLQLQKPNLAWNRISSVSSCRTTPSDVDNPREEFSDYVRVNVFPGNSSAEKLTRSKNFKSNEETIRHSLPALLDYNLPRVCGTSEEVQNDDPDISDLHESLEQLNAMRVFPSDQCIFKQQRGTSDKTFFSKNFHEGDKEEEETLCLESHFAYVPVAVRSSSSKIKKISSLLEEHLNRSSRTSPPLPPPRSKSSHLNFDGVGPKRIPQFNSKSAITRPDQDEVVSKKIHPDVCEEEIWVRNEEPRSNVQIAEWSEDQMNWTSYQKEVIRDERVKNASSASVIISGCEEYNNGESHEYVTALIKHQKVAEVPTKECRTLSASSHPTATVKPRLNSLRLENNSNSSRHSQTPEIGLNTRHPLVAPVGSESFQVSPSNGFNVTKSAPVLIKNLNSIEEAKPIVESSIKLSTFNDTADEQPTSPISKKFHHFLSSSLWLSNTPRDRLLISILDPQQSSNSTPNKFENNDKYKKLLSVDGSDQTLSSPQISTSESPSDEKRPLQNFAPNSFALSQSTLPILSSTDQKQNHETNPPNSSESDDSAVRKPQELVNVILTNYQDMEAKVTKQILISTDKKTQEKFCSHLQQLDTALSLIIKLADQLTKISFDTKTPKDLLTEKQDRLIGKLVEARDLKTNIDKKGELLAVKLKQTMGRDWFELADFLLKTRTQMALLNRSNVDKLCKYKTVLTSYNEVSAD